MHRLDLTTGIWEELPSTPPEPNERYRHEIVVKGDSIFIFGGGTSTEAYGFYRIPVYNLKLQKWTIVKSVSDAIHGYPPPRRCHGLVTFNQHVYICGGYDGETIFNDLWKFDTSSLTWTKLNATVPFKLFFHGCAVTPSGKLVVHGGVMDTTSIFRSKSINYTWLTIPSLREIAWEALLYYYPDIKSVKRTDLLYEGIPINLVDRLDLKTTIPS